MWKGWDEIQVVGCSNVGGKVGWWVAQVMKWIHMKTGKSNMCNGAWEGRNWYRQVSIRFLYKQRQYRICA